uniref:Uncharacterized protein n=1 Tax=Eptatretus burgeri TaxID=7764 RepID=A0A8C4NHY6_EPTBU
METDAKKAHRKRLSGPKAEKKRRKRDGSAAGNKSDGKEAGTACPIRRNPKAFAVHSAVRLQKEFHHAADVALRRERLPVVDRAPLVLPPVIVVLAGPPLVGKTTLLRGLVRNYTRHRLAELHGPITVVAGKQRRVTLIECKNDLGCMIDLAKVADLVSLGFSVLLILPEFMFVPLMSAMFTSYNYFQESLCVGILHIGQCFPCT